jgi:prevent-host-death family protein
MSEADMPARVGVRELRQNLSVYLRRVKEGESLDVTEHGRPVARLVPPAPPDLLDQMVADGRITHAATRLEDLPPPVPLPAGEESLTDTLLRMRDEERW